MRYSFYHPKITGKEKLDNFCECDVISLVLVFCWACAYSPEFCCGEARELENGGLLSEARFFLVSFPANLTGNLTANIFDITYIFFSR